MILATNEDVFLRLLELSSFALFSLVLLHLGVDDLSMSRFSDRGQLRAGRVANLRDLVQLGLMNALMATKNEETKDNNS